MEAMRGIRQKENNLAAYLFLAPALLGLLFYTVFPILGVAGISLTDWTGLQRPRFIGFENYRTLFKDDLFFYPSVKATLSFAFGATLFGVIYTFGIAMMLNQKVPARGVFRSLFFIPYIVPSIGAAVVWSWMYEANFGVFNYFLSLVGIGKIKWLGEAAFATPALIFMTIWSQGNFVVIFLAGLQNVPRTYLEAVEIDGGNAWHKFRHVTLPLMSPIIFFNMLMSLIVNLQVFVPAYSITKGAPDNSTLFMAFLIFREGFQRNKFGSAASISVIFFIFIGGITALIYATSRKWLFFEGE
jgi:multiple sugar transport system permease protein